MSRVCEVLDEGSRVAGVQLNLWSGRVDATRCNVINLAYDARCWEKGKSCRMDGVTLSELK